MGWTIEQKRRYANAMHHLDNVMFEMRQCIDTPNGDEVGIYNSANELRKKVESESQKAETSDEALPIGDVGGSLRELADKYEMDALNRYETSDHALSHIHMAAQARYGFEDGWEAAKKQ